MDLRTAAAAAAAATAAIAAAAAAIPAMATTAGAAITEGAAIAEARVLRMSLLGLRFLVSLVLQPTWEFSLSLQQLKFAASHPNEFVWDLMTESTAL